MDREVKEDNSELIVKTQEVGGSNPLPGTIDDEKVLCF